MEYRILQAYVSHVREQSQFVLMAYTDLRAAVAKHTYARQCYKHAVRQNDRETAPLARRLSADAHRELWYAIYAMMSAVANIDKVLWLNRGGSETARAPVREALGVIEHSASTKTARKVRDVLEHYDQKINEWSKPHAREGLKLRIIGPPISIVGHTVKAVWEGYDPGTDTVSFWDLSVKLGPIVREAQRLIPIAEDIERKCPSCMDEGREHPVSFPVEREYPAGYDLPESPEGDDRNT